MFIFLHFAKSLYFCMDHRIDTKQVAICFMLMDCSVGVFGPSQKTSQRIGLNFAML
jgi:hypothetical protein